MVNKTVRTGKKSIQSTSFIQQTQQTNRCRYFLTFFSKNWKNSGIAGSSMQMAVATAQSSLPSLAKLTIEQMSVPTSATKRHISNTRNFNSLQIYVTKSFFLLLFSSFCSAFSSSILVMIFVRQDCCYVAIVKDKRSVVLIALTEKAIKTLSKIELPILRVDFFQFLDKSHESRSWILEIG